MKRRALLQWLFALSASFIAVTADVTYSRAVILKNLVDVLGELFPAIFGERWNRNSDQPAVVRGVQSEIRCADRFLDRPDQRNVIRLNCNECRIRRGKLGYLVDGRRSAVVFDLDIIED